ncbi:MAG: dicarboxylate/amino acid:cation symporter, partial [Opitutae bacterium]|nr:dicarboxylate/amino acid:cation symporter [Opitutae bacterium]
MKLHWKILISLILSFIIGLWSNLSVDQQSTTPAWFTGLKETCLFIGTLFLNGLKMVVIPLVVTSIICGVAKIGSEAGFGRLGLKTIGFYALTGFFAVCTGLLCVNFMNPGIVDDKVREKMLSSASDSQSAKIEGAIDHADKGLQGLVEIFHRMVPSNLFKAATEGQLLGLIFFGLLFGFFVSRLSPKARETQVAFWESLNAVILSIT